MKKSLVCIFSILALVAAGNENKILNEAVDVYYGRNGAVCDKARAFQLFSEVAKNNNPHAFYWVGYCCIKGDGVEKNIAKGLEYYKKSADELKDPRGTGALAHAYYRGYGVEQDFGKAFQLFQKGAELKDDISLWYLGMMYESGREVEKDDAKAFECYQKSVAQKSWFARYDLGRCYEYGIGTEKNPAKAFEHYRKSYHNTGIFKTAVCLFKGIGTEKNETEGFRQLQRLVKNNSPAGHYLVAVCYENGTGTSQNNELAFLHYKLAAQRGIKEAIERLIYCYSHGIGTTADPAEVEYWQKQKLLTPPISLNDFIASHADNAPAK